MIGQAVVTIVHPVETVTDAHGNEQPNWDTAKRTKVPNCAVAPGSVDSDTAQGRHGGSDVVTVYFPARHPAVEITDRLEIDGVTFEIEQRPDQWNSGANANTIAGTVAEARRYIG